VFRWAVEATGVAIVFVRDLGSRIRLRLRFL
jgi:hypothetical protein